MNNWPNIVVTFTVWQWCFCSARWKTNISLCFFTLHITNLHSTEARACRSGSELNWKSWWGVTDTSLFGLVIHKNINFNSTHSVVHFYTFYVCKWGALLVQWVLHQFVSYAYWISISVPILSNTPRLNRVPQPTQAHTLSISSPQAV